MRRVGSVLISVVYLLLISLSFKFMPYWVSITLLILYLPSIMLFKALVYHKDTLEMAADQINSILLAHKIKKQLKKKEELK